MSFPDRHPTPDTRHLRPKNFALEATTSPDYPQDPTARNQWILNRRGPRNRVNPDRPYHFFWEKELDASGEPCSTATIFLTNRECPWRCLMCDLWKNTLTESLPQGAIPRQISYALRQLPPARQIKLYNNGSFFDPQAIPTKDHAIIAERLTGFERVIVECHPGLVGKTCNQFNDRIPGRLQVAMGLETVHPEILEKLNKRMTLDQFAKASSDLDASGIELRAFILVKPPFMPEEEALHWAARSLDFAFECGATVACLIPTRAGNGAMETLEQSGLFAPPRLTTLATAVANGINSKRGRVFVDLWNIDELYPHDPGLLQTKLRLEFMNTHQRVPNGRDCP